MEHITTNKLVGFQIPKRDSNEEYTNPLYFFGKINKQNELIDSRLTVTYGQNGAGKSTLGRLFEEKNNEIRLIYSNEPKTKQATTPCDNVFVFNENFVTNNICDDSINELLLIGEQVDKNKKIKQIKENLSHLEERLEKLESNDVEKRIHKKEQALWNMIDRDRQWREFQERIDQNTKKRSKGFFKTLLESVGKITEDEITVKKNELARKTDLLVNTRGRVPITWSTETARNPFDEDLIKKHLSSTSIQTTEDSSGNLSKRVAHQRLGASKLSEIKKIFDTSHSDYCPTCFRGVSEEEKKLIVQAIDQNLTILRTSSEKESLKKLKCKIPQKHILPNDVYISSELRTLFDKTQVEFISEIENINQLIERKVDNPLQNIDVDFILMNEATERFNDSIEQVESIIEEHNTNIGKTNDLKKEATYLNYQVTAYYFSPAIDELKKELENKKQLRSEIDFIKDDIEKAKLELARETSSLRNAVVAVDQINRLLAIVYPSERLYLKHEPRQGYAPYSRGRRVKAQHLSTGERNIIALCYFFVQLAEENNYQQSLNSERLIILDDPVSSFDLDNKYGVISLLTQVANDNSEKGSLTKILTLTHDLEVAYSLSKAFKAIDDRSLDKSYINGELQETSFSELNEYKRILSQAYHYAFEDSGANPVPSNDLRRIYEAFVSFTLDSNIAKASSSRHVMEFLNSIGKDGTRFAYASKHFINSGSHTQENIQMMDYGLFRTSHEGDYSSLVKDLLLFIHSVSPIHIPSVVGNKYGEIKLIKDKLDTSLKG